MEELRKLVRIVTNRSQKNFPLLEFKGNYISKEAEFFLKIKAGKCETEAQAAALMYKTGAKDSRMRMLKSRLRKKLLNHLFFLDFSDSNLKVSHRYEQECQTLLYQARTLVNEGEYKISGKLVETALQIAVESEFTSIIINCQELLLSIYSFSNNYNKFNKLQKKIKNYRQLLTIEEEAQHLYFFSRLEINKSVLSKKKFLPKLKNITLRLEELWRQTKSVNIYNNYFILLLIEKQMEGDFEKILKLTSTSEKLLQQGKINKKRFDGRYNKYMNVYAYLRVKEYLKGLDAAEKHLRFFNRSTNNWFAFMENYFLLAMHAGKYDQAAALFAEVQRNGFFKKVSSAAQERWALYGAYLHYVNPSEKLLKQSNYRRLITAVPEYSKDKLGFNIAILILQFIHYVEKQDTEALLYRMEGLKKYAGRHFSNQLSKRHQLFFKLLTLVVKANLGYDEAKTKGEPFWQRLKETPIPGDAFTEIEIIPYEQLWQLLLQILKKTHY